MSTTPTTAATSTEASPVVPPELTAGMPASDDHRRYARRPCKLRAQLKILRTWSTEIGDVRDFEVIVRNISRTGVCFVFFRQLFPDDRVTLDFGDLLRHYRVARCRRLGQNCYEVGLAICAAD